MYTVKDIIKNIRIRGSIPTSQQLFTDERLVDLLTDEMHSSIVPQVMSVQEDYFLKYEDQEITESRVFDIPERAIGMKLKDVFICDDSGNELTKLSRMHLEDLGSLGYGFNSSNYNFLGAPLFYIQGNQVITVGLNQGSKLRMYYYRRANSLVTMENAGKVTQVNHNSNTIVLDNIPATWSVNDSVCVVKGKPGFDCKIESTRILSLSSPTLGIDSTQGIVPGDYVALEGCSPIPQLPVEAHSVLAQSVVVKVLESLGDTNGFQVAQMKLAEQSKSLLVTLNPRVDGAPKKITSRNNLFSYSRRYR